MYVQDVQLLGEPFRLGSPLSENEIPLPLVVMEGMSTTKEEIRPILDIVWQSAGLPGVPETRDEG